MKLLIIDNYDSFTFNLKHICEMYVDVVDVYRNDTINIESVCKYDKIIISPGPGLPVDAGISTDLIRQFYDKKPILGVCLGAQAIADVFGCKLFNLKNVMHGKKSMIKILDKTDQIYRGLPNKIMVGRYHSWAINLSNHPKLIATSVDESSIIMSFKHIDHPVIGLQYHPESILTPFGSDILKNWLLY